VRKVKDAEALRSLADELGCRDRITPVVMEVTDPESVAEAEQVVHRRLEERGLKLMAVINNAGIAGRAPVELVAPKNVQRMINVP
jgi:NAD(P)-dependent dehydrogenase (short-subunit alcohol dehydrogenase family)